MMPATAVAPEAAEMHAAADDLSGHSQKSLKMAKPDSAVFCKIFSTTDLILCVSNIKANYFLFLYCIL
jgi:hypothetical protein